jgi:hypothetical protein
VAIKGDPYFELEINQRWERVDMRVPFDDVSAIYAQVFKLGIDEVRPVICGQE